MPLSKKRMRERKAQDNSNLNPDISNLDALQSISSPLKNKLSPLNELNSLGQWLIDPARRHQLQQIHDLLKPKDRPALLFGTRGIPFNIIGEMLEIIG